MILRRLKQEEHGKTRKLWEEVFPEDTKAFLDYYYYIKARDNQIFVIEEDGEIRSMIHLNPYQIKIENRFFPAAYIVAVATQKPYRRRGYMGRLLHASLREMYEQKMPFTFLMPAAEAIYKPYDFRFIYDQPFGSVEISRRRGQGQEVTGEIRAAEIHTDPEKRKKTECSDAGIWDAEELELFYKEYFEPMWQVTAVKDREYYQTMIMEQQSERGGVRILRNSGQITGLYAYAAEEGLEVREPLYLQGNEEEFIRSVEELAADSVETVKIYGCPDELASGRKPMIMARIVCLPAFLCAVQVPKDVTLECSFAVIDPIIHQNSRIWKITGRTGETQLRIREYEDSEGVIPIADLTEYLFGRIGIQELSERQGVIMTGHLAQELEKITRLTRVCFNEVV